jgi:hypothetical protein
MIVTEQKIIGIFGYTKDQIRHRRQTHWQEGLHFHREPAGATMYSPEEIEQWIQQESTNVAANELLGGMKASTNARSRSISRIPKLM